MPRIPRNQYPPGYYHIMNRGIGKEAIFGTPGERNFYKNLAANIFQEYPVDILAYCIMGNHYHFVMKGEPMDFSSALQRTNLSYAMAYNARRDRVGHVFQNRFKSEFIDSERYLFAAIRYVHNNPVKGNLVKSPGEYPWSSYREYFSPREMPGKYLTKGEARNEIFRHFEESPDIFEKFHRGKDHHLFIDVHENFKERKVEAAMNLIENHFPGVDFEKKEEMTSDIHLLYRIVSLLLAKTSMTQQEIADVLGLSQHQVGRIARRKRNNEKETEFMH